MNLQTAEYKDYLKRLGIDTRSRQELVDAGFNFAGNTDDLTMIAEIRRDYLAAGYSEIVFIRANKNNPLMKVFYYTKHPTINP